MLFSSFTFLGFFAVVVAAYYALPHRFRLPAADLISLIERTRFAISTEETRFYLNGIYIHAADSDGTKTLRAVATDGHRLARVLPFVRHGGRTLLRIAAVRSRRARPENEREGPVEPSLRMDTDRDARASVSDRRAGGRCPGGSGHPARGAGSP